MDFEPQIELAVKRKTMPTLNGPGIFWVLIILALISMALAINFFGKPINTAGTVATPSETLLIESKPTRLYTISYKNGVFSPTNLRIHSGDTVRFKNESIFGFRIISDDIVGFDSVGDIPQGSYFSFTFAAKGIFSYRNGKNTNEVGTIIVR